MSSVYALIPAKYRSTGIAGKNWRPIADGLAPAQRAINCACAVTAIDRIIVSTEADEAPWNMPDPQDRVRHLHRSQDLAQDTTPMVDVVKDAMLSYPGEPDDLWLLLQPTQPLRKPEHITAAVTLLQETQADSVVSVVKVPLAHSPDMQVVIDQGGVEPYIKATGPEGWWTRVTMRQQCTQTYIRDGTVYAFWRRTVAQYGSIYGRDVRSLLIPASESCPLDTMEDWHEAERRLRA